MYGKHHSEETKNLISSTRKGYRWVNNGSDEVYAKGEDLQKYLDLGYTYGRLYKKKDSETIESTISSEIGK